MLAERAAASLSRIATWGPTSEELALLDATAGATELPAGLAGAVVPIVAVVAVVAVTAVPAVAAVPVVLDAEALPVAGLAVEALPVVPAALAPVAEAAGAAVALPAVAAEGLAVLLPVELVAVTADPVVELSEATPAWRTIKRLSKG